MANACVGHAQFKNGPIKTHLASNQPWQPWACWPHLAVARGPWSGGSNSRSTPSNLEPSPRSLHFSPKTPGTRFQPKRVPVSHSIQTRSLHGCRYHRLLKKSFILVTRPLCTTFRWFKARLLFYFSAFVVCGCHQRPGQSTHPPPVCQPSLSALREHLQLPQSAFCIRDPKTTHNSSVKPGAFCNHGPAACSESYERSDAESLTHGIGGARSQIAMYV